jgi:cell division protein FtsA
LNSQDFIVSLDIGTSKVRVIIGELNNHSFNIVGVGIAQSDGIKKGSIVDIDATVKSIKEAVAEAERMVGINISGVYVGLSGNHIQLLPTQGVVAVSSEDREIRQEDVDRVIDAAKVVAIPPERVIVDVVPREFVVDGLKEIKDPRGMIGVRLEMEGTLVTGSKTVLHNIIRCIERAEIELKGLFLQPMAEAELVLSKDERQLGTALVDIGAGTSTIAIFSNGDLVAHSVLPIGGDNITNDIAYVFYTSTDMAEKIKMKYGCALIDDSSDEEVFDVPRIGSDVTKKYSQLDLANVIEPRAAEILYLIKKEVERLGYGKLSGGYVLTGGACSMPGFHTLAKELFDHSVRIAFPDYIGVRDPSYTAGVGILHYVSKYSYYKPATITKEKAVQGQAPKSSKKKAATQSGAFEKLRNWFSEFI